MAARLYVATYNKDGVAAWSEWTLGPGASILAIGAIDVPGRGPVLDLIIERPTGIYLESVTLSEGEPG